MADLKITQLTELTSPLISDIVPIVDDPSGSPVTKKITLSNLLAQKTVVTVSTSDGSDYVCDGTADDVQIQAALDAVNSVGGGVVFIKNGTYNIAKANLPMTIGSNTVLIGESWATILLLPDLTSGSGGEESMFENKALTTGNSNIYVGNMKVSMGAPYESATGMNTWYGGIVFRGCSNSMIDRIWLVNGSLGVMANTTYSNTASCLTLGTNKFNIVQNCLLDSVASSCQMSQGTDLYWINNKVNKAWDDALIVSGSVDGLVLRDSTFGMGPPTADKGSNNAAFFILNDGATGLGINGMRNILIDHCTFKDNSGYTVSSPNGSGIAINTAKDVTIKNCFFYDNGADGINNAGGTTTQNITIEGCTIRDNGDKGIDFGSTAGNACKNVRIEGNRIYNNDGGYGVYFTNQTNNNYDGITISNNDVYDDQDTPTQTVGIYFLSTGSGINTRNIQIENNNVHDTTTPISVTTSGGATFSALRVRNNLGFITEATGTGTIANGATSATITHGLSWTPTLSEITITGGENPTADIGTIWVDTIGATTFKVNCEVDPSTSGFDFGWKVTILRTTL